jgi:O-antigen ligase
LFVNLMFPALILWGLCDKSLKRWQVVLSLVAALGMLFAVVATYSRAGTALSGMCVIAALFKANLAGRTTRVRLVSVLVFLLVLGGGIKAADSIRKRVATAPKSSEQAREEFNAAAGQMVKNNFWGVGLNNFSAVLTANPDYNRFLQVMKGEKQSGVCHHIYWLTTAELGYPGLAAFVFMQLNFLWLALSKARGRRLENMLLFGLGVGAAACHLSGFLEWAFRITPVTQVCIITSAAMLGFRMQLEREAAHGVSPALSRARAA